MTVAQAADSLNIKKSTAKLIVARFKKYGNIFKRKNEREDVRELLLGKLIGFRKRFPKKRKQS